MLGMTGMAILVITILALGALSGVLLFYLKEITHRDNLPTTSHFSQNLTQAKMENSTVSVDDIINGFKLI